MKRTLIMLLCAFACCMSGNTESEKHTEKIPSSEPERTRWLMKNVIIDYADFSQTSVQDVLKYLWKLSIEKDPAKKGINIIYCHEKVDDSSDKQTEEKNEEEESSEPALGCYPANISLENTLIYIARACGLKIVFDRETVILSSNNIPLERLDRRVYHFEPAANFADELEKGPANSVKDYFIRRGINFPHGSSVYYDSNQLLSVVSTPENQASIARIVDEWNAVDPNILIGKP